ncbi:MAG: amidohydrolase family protein [Deltaproteobacteria bacterium]|nr:amidohydrolase family protein [Deltaproteobacteria bacterium]
MLVLSDLRFDGERFVREPATLRITGGILTSIEPGTPPAPPSATVPALPSATVPDLPAATPDDDVLDARGRLVMPGLIDAHAHIARAGFFEPGEPPLQVAQIIRNFQGALRAGVTTIADMGCTIPLMRRLRALTDHDPLAGPRFLGAGPVLTAPEGYPFVWISKLWRHAEAALPIADEVAAAHAVGRTVEGGMDHVKVAIMHESFARTPLPALTPKAARAVVAEAHALGRRVYAHAHSTRDYEVALDAGVDGLMHSSFDPLSPDLVQRIVDAGVAVNPTLWAYDSTCLTGACRIHERADLQRHATPALRRSWRRFADAYAASGPVFPRTSIVAGVQKHVAEGAMRVAAANARILHDAGVPLVFGNDASFGVALLARPIDELDAMRRAGMSVAACLRSATAGAADLLGAPHLGRLRPGAAADLVIAPRGLEHDLALLDADREGITLEVVARGRRVPATTTPARLAAIALAYVQGTGDTLVRTVTNATRALGAKLAGSPASPGLLAKLGLTARTTT